MFVRRFPSPKTWVLLIGATMDLDSVLRKEFCFPLTRDRYIKMCYVSVDHAEHNDFEEVESSNPCFINHSWEEHFISASP